MGTQCKTDDNLFLNAFEDGDSMMVHIQRARKPDRSVVVVESSALSTGTPTVDTVKGGWIDIMNDTLKTKARGTDRF